MINFNEAPYTGKEFEFIKKKNGEFLGNSYFLAGTFLINA